MKKNIILIAFSVVLCIALSGCGDSKSYDYNLDKYITLPQYKGISIDENSEDYTIGIKYSIYNSLNSSDGLVTTTKLDSGTVQVLDSVNISYNGQIDGKDFEGGSSDSYDLVIGSSSFIEGFETGLIGKKVGDTEKLNISFPENYSSEDLAGKPVVFTVKINSITRPSVPEVTDEIAKKLGYENSESFNTTTKDNYKKNCLWKQVVEGTKVTEYPQEEIDNYVDMSILSLRKQYSSQGTTLEQSLEQAGMTLDQYKERLQSYARPAVLQQMVSHSISDKEKIELKDSEIDSYISTNYSGQTLEDYERQSVAESLLMQKVMKFVTDNAS